MSLSLFQIENDLAQLVAERDRADSEGDPEAVATIDGLITQYLTAEAAKIDSGCALLRQDAADSALLREEATRLVGRANALDNRQKRIKEAWCAAMAAAGVKELKSQHNTIRRVGNGGMRKLETSEAVPVTFSRATMVLSIDLLRRILSRLTEVECRREVYKTTTELDNTAIRAALERGESVPGAKLLDRGEHLEVK